MHQAAMQPRLLDTHNKTTAAQKEKEGMPCMHATCNMPTACQMVSAHAAHHLAFNLTGQPTHYSTAAHAST